MPFVRDARRIARTLPQNDVLRLTIEFLLQNAVGHNNAVPLSSIIAHLNNHHHNISEVMFQQTILKETRSNSIFIGSSQRGYFLIDTIEDAVVMRDFYVNRIVAEQQNLNNLIEQATVEGWDIRD